MRQQIENYIASNREAVIRDWKNLVNLEGSLREVDNMRTVADFVQKLFSEAGVDCAVYSAKDDVPPVVAGVIGADRPGRPVLFAGHFDTVFNKGTYGPDPFRIEGEKAYGPGVLDMKGGIVIALYVIKALEAASFADRPIRICFCGDEEGGPQHEYAKAHFEKWAKGCIAGFNMETGPVNNDLCVGRKWIMGGEFNVKGVSAHSGNNYEVGRNAIVEAAHKVIAIQGMNDMEKGTHMNPAVIAGGKMSNSVPDQCKVTYSGRFASADEIIRVRQALQQLFAKPDVDGTTITYTLSDAAGGFADTKENWALLDFVKQVCRQEGVPEVGGIFLGGGSDAESIANAGVPVLCSCGVRGEWNHTDREYAVVESMFERAKLWSSVVLQIEDFKI